MSKNVFSKLLVFSGLLMMPFLYNNCSEKNFVLPETGDLPSVDSGEGNLDIDLSKPSCVGKADGEKILELTVSEQAKEIACPFGGKRIVVESVSKEYFCAGEVTFDSGNEITTQIREEDQGCKLVADPVVPVPPKACGEVANGAKKFLIEGGLSDAISCGRGVYSTATFSKQSPPAKIYLNNFQRKVEYLCVNGVLQKTGVIAKGNFLGGTGRCAEPAECVPGDFSYTEILNLLKFTRYSNKFGQAGSKLDIVTQVGFKFVNEKFQCVVGGIWQKCPFVFGTLQQCQ